MREESKAQATGIVTSRKCPHCGHHEIGFTASDGVFHALKPGMLIRVLEISKVSTPLEDRRGDQQAVVEIEDADQAVYEVWVPDALRVDRRLRLKYGVSVKARASGGRAYGEIYHQAYLDKLCRLIEKELNTPVPVIVDRFFAAPHLASGNPREIAEAMWAELEEIRQPAELMREWLEKQSEESFDRLIYPVPREEMSDDPASDDQLKKELEALTLEEFLDML